MSITIIPINLPNAIIGSAYNTFITAIGGSAAYTYTITSGTLPTGLTLTASTGKISGTPTTKELSSFTITATDSLAATGTLDLTISSNTTLVSLADHYNRLQHFMCCLGSKGSELASKLRYSSDCCCEINTFELLVMYWEVLICYNPLATGNCLTQAQIDTIWDDISKKCGICFNPYGSIYTSLREGSSRITAGGDLRITASDDFRITPLETPTSKVLDGIDYMSIGGTFIVT